MSVTDSDPAVADFVVWLRRAGLQVADDPGTRARYSSDASLYRILPVAVAFPRRAEDVEAVLSLARTNGYAVTSRGAGTSVAGNAIGPGLVLDFSRYMNRVLEVDPDAATAVVEPGVVQADLQRAAAPHGLRFGPDPSTHTRCTIGGMIGNNACGSHSLGYGRTSDNVVGLGAFMADGTWLRTGRDHEGRPLVHGAQDLVQRLHALMAGNLAVARTEFGRFGRQVSGYAVQHLLPERFDLTSALIGSEGTLVVVTEATVRLVEEPAQRVLVVLGFDDIIAAADASPAVVAHGPTACEGLDSRLIEVIRSRRGPGRVPDLPAGRAWLFVELTASERDVALDRAAELVADIGAVDAAVVDDPVLASALWRIREDGAGLAGTAPSGRPAWPGWEDAAVPPAALGQYLRDFDDLVAAHGMTSAPFGHFGDGCMHVRLDFPFERPGGAEVFGAFLREAAALVARCGGTLSGEHGDGRARSELLPLMYSPEAVRLFAGIKHIFDPAGTLNPGVLVDPDPATQAVRVEGPFAVPRTTGFPLIHDGGDLASAVHRCTGVGKCRADNSSSGGLMCPSYLATRDEKDSTRGRARVLQELIRGDRPDWRAAEVHEALDLCLSCKGCTSDCPTGIDMPTYKSEVLYRAYRWRLRPRTHYSLGRLPLWARLVGPLAPMVNAVLARPVVRRLALWAAGVDPRRSIPQFSPDPFRRSPLRDHPPAPGQPVLLFVDSFSDGFTPAVAQAASTLLIDAGFSPRFLDRNVCCGLTWISTGQLDAARRILRRTVDELAHHVDAGTPVVGLEPSCTAVLRRDAVDLLDDDTSRRVAAATHTLAELLQTSTDWQPPDLSGTTVVVQPHCHQQAVMGWDADRRLLARTGATVRAVAGCCGLAGNFGVERGHYEVSVAVAEQNLLPALDADPRSVVLADGFSCRTQIQDLRSRPALHLAELLTGATPDTPPAVTTATHTTKGS